MSRKHGVVVQVFPLEDIREGAAMGRTMGQSQASPPPPPLAHGRLESERPVEDEPMVAVPLPIPR